MNTKKGISLLIYSTLALVIGALALTAVNEKNTLVQGVGSNKTMTIASTSSFFQTSDILDYTANYETDKNYRVITFDSHILKAAVLHSSYYNCTTTVNDSSIVKALYSDGEAFFIASFGLNNITSLTATVAKDNGGAVESVTASFYDANWTFGETKGATSVTGSATLTPTGLNESGNSYVPTWVVIGVDDTSKSNATTPYIALTSLSMTWNC